MPFRLPLDELQWCFNFANSIVDLKFGGSQFNHQLIPFTRFDNQVYPDFCFWTFELQMFWQLNCWPETVATPTNDYLHQSLHFWLSIAWREPLRSENNSTQLANETRSINFPIFNHKLFQSIIDFCNAFQRINSIESVQYPIWSEIIQ